MKICIPVLGKTIKLPVPYKPVLSGHNFTLLSHYNKRHQLDSDNHNVTLPAGTQIELRSIKYIRNKSNALANNVVFKIIESSDKSLKGRHLYLTVEQTNRVLYEVD